MKLKHIALLLILFTIASACPFCTGDTNQASKDAYLGSALSMSMLPILLLGLGALAFKALKKKYA